MTDMRPLRERESEIKIELATLEAEIERLLKRLI